MSYRRLKLAAASLAMALVLIPSAASSQYYGGRDSYRGRNDYRRGDYYADNGYYARDGRHYARAMPAYDGPPPGYRQTYRDDRVQRRCGSGTGGTILGAIAGGLLGDAAAGRGDRGAGAIVGAGVGALAGRAVARDCR